MVMCLSVVGWPVVGLPVQCPVYCPEPGKVDLVMMKDLFFWMASRALLPAWTSSRPEGGRREEGDGREGRGRGKERERGRDIEQ